MDIRIVGAGAWTVIEAPDDIRDRIKDRLTFEYIDISNQKHKVVAYEEHGNLLYVPRNFIKVDPAGYWDEVDIEFNGTLTDVQQELFLSAISGLAENYGGVIHATTGIGKTVLALAIASYFKLRTLVIVPTAQIASQWVDAVAKFTNTEAGMIRQNTLDIAPITVAMIQSLCSRDGYNLHKELFGLVIWDEVHRVPTSLYSATATMFNSKYRLGLSATPFRRDGLHWLIKLHIGNIIAKHLVKEVIPKVLIVNYHGFKFAPKGIKFESRLSRLISKLATDVSRTELLSSYIRAAYERGREVLVLSDRISHLSVLAKASGIPESDYGFMTSKVKQKDRQILFGTYGCAGIGFDKPSLDTLIFATPRSDVVQAVGRMMRKGQKRNNPLVIDIVDSRIPDLVLLAKKRIKFYTLCGCEIVEVFKEGISYGRPRESTLSVSGGTYF